MDHVVHGWNNSSSELEAHQRSQKDYVNATAILKQDIRLQVRTISYMVGTMCSCLKLTHQRYVYVITIVPNTQSDVTISPSTNTSLATSSTMILGRAIMILVGQVTINYGYYLLVNYRPYEIPGFHCYDNNKPLVPIGHHADRLHPRFETV